MLGVFLNEINYLIILLHVDRMKVMGHVRAKILVHNIKAESKEFIIKN